MMATIDVDFAVYKALTIRRETEEFGHQTLGLVKLGWRNLVGDRIEFMSQKGSEKLCAVDQPAAYRRASRGSGSSHA